MRRHGRGGRLMPSAVSLPVPDDAYWDDACVKAMNLQLAGQAEVAERMYRSILQAAPLHAAANHCLGMLNVQLRRPSEAVPFLLTALNLHPEIPDYWLGYLEALLPVSKMQKAINNLIFKFILFIVLAMIFGILPV
jgi:predicted Zn-dependent protease